MNGIFKQVFQYLSNYNKTIVQIFTDKEKNKELKKCNLLIIGLSLGHLIIKSLLNENKIYWHLSYSYMWSFFIL